MSFIIKLINLLLIFPWSTSFVYFHLNAVTVIQRGEAPQVREILSLASTSMYYVSTNVLRGTDDWAPKSEPDVPWQVLVWSLGFWQQDRESTNSLVPSFTYEWTTLLSDRVASFICVSYYKCLLFIIYLFLYYLRIEPEVSFMLAKPSINELISTVPPNLVKKTFCSETMFQNCPDWPWAYNPREADFWLSTNFLLPGWESHGIS